MNKSSLRVLLSTRGSHGDVVPFIGLAKHLQSMGHQPVLATCRSFETLAMQNGVPFVAVAPHQDEVCRDLGMTAQEISARSMNPWRGGKFVRDATIKPYFNRIIDDLWAASAGADLVVANPLTAAWVAMVAEAQNITWYTMAVNCAPLLLKSAKEPPVLPAFSMKPVVKVLGPRLYGYLVKRAGKSRGQVAFLDNKARELGVYDSQLHPLLDRSFSRAGVLALVPPQFMGSRVPDDLGLPPLQFLGFSRFDPTAGQPLDGDLVAFLDQGPPPLLFTLGTSVICQAPGVYAHWSRICKQMGQRAVFIGDPSTLGPDIPSSQRVLPWVSLPMLMPRCLAVINPGGVGVCAQTVAAGLPQLIVPFAFDQPDNAMRLARMGAALVVKPRQARGLAMVQALRRLCGDQALHARARALMGQLNPMCGTLMAAHILDERHALPMVNVA